MKAIMIMFDSLNRHYLPSYGCEWTKLPNFRRLEEKCLVFDQFYAGSLPCMPARRELHTARYNFLHRSWGPMEPFDESAITHLNDAGVYTHLVSDHFHYWEDGGIGYHTKYNSWESIRGQQGDLWIGEVKNPEIPDTLSSRAKAKKGWPYASWRQDWINRKYIDTEEKMPQARTFEQGLAFIERNKEEDQWFLQIETFDPHEPFYTQEAYKKLYPHNYTGKTIDWPDYGPNQLDREATKHVQYEYAALLSMCDHYLGQVLDKMDEYGLWEDTLLIVNTDHGFMLGEKDWMGKNVQPMYNEVVHLPFYIYDPRYSEQKGRRQALAQTIDIAPTLLEYFGAQPLSYGEGKSLSPVIKADKPIRKAALYGMFGGSVNITDGQYVYMHTPKDVASTPLYEYTLMPTHMNNYFSEAELQEINLVEGFKFMKGCKV
ncbi:MAG: sulfatase, partial [Cellulosilyticaceae bacterium]